MRSTDVVNATLVSVTSQSGEDDFDAPAVAGAAKFAEPGVGVFYEQRSRRVVTRDGARVVVWRELTVREELPVDWQVGDVVTVAPVDGGALVGTVSAVQDPHAPRGEAGEVVLTLDLVA